MTKYFKRLPFIFALAMLFVASCSNDDQGAIALNGGEVFRSQVVTINLPNTNLSLKEYEATLDGRAIMISRSEDHKLLFLMPEDADLGLHTLTIPKLNEATVTYDIKETVLDETPVKTLEPLFENIKIYNQTLTNATAPEALNMQKNITCFTNYYNNASDEEKTQLALAYKANKTQFDQIILNDYSNVEGRLTREDRIILSKFLIAVASIEIGSWLATSGGHPGVRAMGIVIAGIATTSAINYYKQFIEVEVKEIGCSIGSILGVNQRSSVGNALSLQNDVSSTFSINTLRRKLNSSDATGTQSAAISFFKSREAYNYVINKVNAAIRYVNDNNSFFTFETFELAELPASTPANLAIADQEIFKKITFSVSHPNLKLVSSSLESDGQLNLRIKIIGTPKTLPVETFLNYKYSDDFSSFSGKIPLIVEQNNPFIGNWKLLTFNNGYYPGEFYTMSYVCSKPYNAFTTSDATFVFTTNTFSNNQTVIEKAYNITYDGDCKLLTDEPDTEFTETLNPRGTYVVKGKTATLTYLTNDGAIIGSINMVLIDSNKFQLEGSVYVRQ